MKDLNTCFSSYLSSDNVSSDSDAAERDMLLKARNMSKIRPLRGVIEIGGRTQEENNKIIYRNLDNMFNEEGRYVPPDERRSKK